MVANSTVPGPDYCTCENKIPRRCSHCGNCWWCGKPVDPAESVEFVSSIGWVR